MPIQQIYQTMIDNALNFLNNTEKKEISSLLYTLFEHVLDDLKQGVEANPIEHHLTVLQHALEIAKVEGFTALEIKQAAALALLHDIAPTKKITTQMVEEADQGKKSEFDRLRKEYRKEHMKEGAMKARVRMQEVNEILGYEALTPEDIDVICNIIAIHDNPSNKIPISKDSRLAVAQREADRLWMLTELGIDTDLWRSGKDITSVFLRQEQVEWNINAFKKERNIYDENQEDFCNNETFFRTQGGYKIYCRWCEYWELLFHFVGFDLGGTNSKTWNEKEKKEIQLPSKQDLSQAEERNILNFLDIQLKAEHNNFSKLKAIGVALPCTMAPHQGERKILSTVTKFAKLTESENGHNGVINEMAEVWKAELGAKVFILNDGEAASISAFTRLREQYGEKFKNVMVVTLGTSIGVGFIFNGQTYIGPYPSRASHIILDPTGDWCIGENHKGCWKMLGGDTARRKLAFNMGFKESGFKLTKKSLKQLEQEDIPPEILEKLVPLKYLTFTKKQDFLDVIREEIGQEEVKRYEKVFLKHAKDSKSSSQGMDIKAIAEKAESGSKKAKLFFRLYAENVAKGIATIMSAVPVECVVIAGGVAKAGDLLIKPLKKRLQKGDLFDPDLAPLIKLTTIDKVSVAHGAQIFAFEELKKQESSL